ncbi:MAG: DUF4214 domain-containing protein [Rhodobacteraceae bacterium]|nr:DUF4214 domain-containing protein [Paracoccaceae bacterium]
MPLFGNQQDYSVVSIQGLFPAGTFENLFSDSNSVSGAQFSADAQGFYFLNDSNARLGLETSLYNRLLRVDMGTGAITDPLANLVVTPTREDTGSPFSIQDYAVSSDESQVLVKAVDFDTYFFHGFYFYFYGDNGIYLQEGDQTTLLTPSTAERIQLEQGGNDVSRLFGVFGPDDTIFYDFRAEDPEGVTLADKELALADAQFLRRLPDGTVQTSDLNAPEGNPALGLQEVTGNGRQVLLAPLDTAAGRTLSLIDIATGTSAPVITNAGYEGANGLVEQGFYSTARVSDDGLFVLFDSLGHASDSHSGGAEADLDSDLFLRNMATGSIVEITQSTQDGTPSEIAAGARNESYQHFDMSGDGRFIAFASPVKGHLPGDAGGAHDLLVRDMHNGTLHRAAVDLNGVAYSGNLSIRDVVLSSDGRYLTYSGAVPGTTGWSVGLAKPLENAQYSEPARDIFVTDLHALGIWSPLVERAEAGATLQGTVYDETLIGDHSGQRFEATQGDDSIFAGGFAAAHAMPQALEVYALYGAAFGRTPDAAGFQDWTLRMFTGSHDVHDVAAGFTGSAEFRARYSETDAFGFVDQLYLNVLNRPADAGGRAAWGEAIGNGMSFANALLGFAQSAEYTARIATEATDFTLQQNPQWKAGDVFRLYQATLDRLPDVAGFLGWSDSLASGTPYLRAVEGFVLSPEFTQTYGALEDGALVAQLYRNVLNREGEEAGIAGWVAALNDGLSRAELVQGFAQSREFILAQRQPLEDWMRAQGVNDTLNAGAGDNILAGGSMSDRFVFAPDHVGKHTVLELEPWDELDLTAFNYASDDAARALLTQQGTSVVFADGSVEITFLNSALASFDDQMLLT